MAELKSEGKLTFNFDGDIVELTEEDLLIDAAQTEGYVSDTQYDVTVVIDTNLTPELIEEGFVRELISKIQTMRKEADFQVTDHIVVSVMDNDKLTAIVKANERSELNQKFWRTKLFTTVRMDMPKNGISMVKS